MQCHSVSSIWRNIRKKHEQIQANRTKDAFRTNIRVSLHRQQQTLSLHLLLQQHFVSNTLGKQRNQTSEAPLYSLSILLLILFRTSLFPPSSSSQDISSSILIFFWIENKSVKRKTSLNDTGSVSFILCSPRLTCSDTTHGHTFNWTPLYHSHHITLVIRRGLRQLTSRC